MLIGEVVRKSWRRVVATGALGIALFATSATLSGSVNAQAFSEGFDDVTTLVPQGWAVRNNSLPVGTLSWIQGAPTVFTSHSGGENSYIAVTYFSVAGANTISNWLFTPNRTFSNGDIIRFYTRTVDTVEYPDRLEVRLSTNGTSTDVGTTPFSEGDFTTVLLTINPDLTIEGYPSTWTQYSITLSGLPGGSASGRIAFRYYVDDGGPNGNNSEYIGIDSFEYVQASAPAIQHTNDFNGDGKTDYTLVRDNSGTYTWYSNFGGSLAPTIDNWGQTGDQIAPADYDGDQKTDIAIWRPSSPQSQFLVLRSTTSTLDTFNFGQPGDNPKVTADYTGDGKADPAIFRNGVYWFLASSGPLAGTQVAVSWGLPTDRPVAGDFDGDGKADFCVYRNVSGAGQFIMAPGNGAGGLGTAVYTNWGLPTDTVATGDYDGDGKADYAVTRDSGGNKVWYIRTSSGTNQIINWGLAGDVNAQGDYDGDGKTDAAVYRGSATEGSSGFWVFRSNGGPAYVQWGLQNDVAAGTFLNY